MKKRIEKKLTRSKAKIRTAILAASLFMIFTIPIIILKIFIDLGTYTTILMLTVCWIAIAMISTIYYYSLESMIDEEK